MNGINRLVTCVAVCVALSHPRAGAQAPRLEAGSRVRVQVVGSNDWRPAGRVVLLTGDSLVVAAQGQPSLALRRADVSQLDVSLGMHRNTLNGLELGMLLGAATGVVIGLASGNDPCNPQSPLGCGGSPEHLTAAGKAGIAGSVLAVIGGAVGSIAGACYKSERWVTVDRSAAVPVIDGRGRFGVSIRF
jgi:hypothetical protein